MLSKFLALALASSVGTAAPAVDTSKRALFALPPSADSFYWRPDNLDSYSPGEIIDSRSVDLDAELILTAASAEQVVYKTTDVNGEDSWSVATVIAPHNPQADAKLFSYQFWEDATNINCSPSYSLLVGARAPDGVTSVLDTGPILDWALLNGYYVVAADHEGPNSAFFAGLVGGYAGLDGIRAALGQLNLSDKTPVGLYGYSGGAHASVWMSALHGSYAPELNIVGAAHGGTPVDANATVNHLDGQPFSGFVLGAIVGLANADPKLKAQIEPHMDSSIKRDVGVMEADTFCVLNEMVAFGDRTFHTQFDVDFFTYPPLKQTMERESLMKGSIAPNISTPKFPRYIYHAEADDVIPFGPLNQYVQEQCSDGANIAFVPFNGNNHPTVEVIGLPGALQFVQQALEGKLPSVQCGQKPEEVLTIFSEDVSQVLGQPTADAINALEGVVTPFGKIIFKDI